MASGSLYLTSPMPVEVGKPMLTTLEKKVEQLEQKSLRECSVGTLVQAMEDLGLSRMWLQEDEELRDWETKPVQVEGLMIGDTEYEVRSPHSPSLVTTCLLTPYAKTVRDREKRDRNS
jgi:hypothetical protein